MIKWIKKYKYKITRYKNTEFYTLVNLYTLDELRMLGLIYNKNEGSVKVKSKTARITNRDIMDILVPMKSDISELKTDVAELKTDVAELKTDVAKNTEVLKKHFPEDFKEKAT